MPFKALLSQVTASSTFKVIYEITPGHNIITQSHNYKKRANYRIKTIVKEKLLPRNYLDSLIEIDPSKNFVENHIGTKEYFSYDTLGLLIQQSLIPLNAKISKKDSAEHRFVKTHYDSLKKEYMIEYYYNNQLYHIETYSNTLLKKEISPKYPFRLIWTDKNKIQHDTNYSCDLYVKYKYDNKGQLIFKEYNNTDYSNPERLCDIVESENYIYEKNKVIITKYPYKEQPRDNEKYINEIIKNNKGVIIKSKFYANDLSDLHVMYTIKYDKKNNIKDVYESYSVKERLEYKLYHYENIYNKEILREVVERYPGFNMYYYEKRYYYDESGLLNKIGYFGSDGSDLGSTERFTYTFY